MKRIHSFSKDVRRSQNKGLRRPLPYEVGNECRKGRGWGKRCQPTRDLPGGGVGPLVFSGLSLPCCKDVLTGFPREYKAGGPWVGRLHSPECLLRCELEFWWTALVYSDCSVPCSSFCDGLNCARETGGEVGHGSGEANQTSCNATIWWSCHLREEMWYLKRHDGPCRLSPRALEDSEYRI